MLSQDNNIKEKFKNICEFKDLMENLESIDWILLDYQEREKIYPIITDFIEKKLFSLEVNDVKKILEKIYYIFPQKLLIKIMEYSIEKNEYFMPIEALKLNEIFKENQEIIKKYQLFLNTKNEISSEILESKEIKELKYEIYLNALEEKNIQLSTSFHYFILNNFYYIREKEKNIFNLFLQQESLSTNEKIDLLIDSNNLFIFSLVKEINQFINNHSKELQKSFSKVILAYLEYIEEDKNIQKYLNINKFFNDILDNENFENVLKNNQEIQKKMIKLLSQKQVKEINGEQVNLLQKLFLNQSPIVEKLIQIDEKFFQVLKQPILKKEKNLTFKESFFQYIILKNNNYNIRLRLENIWKNNIDYQNKEQKNQLAYLIFENFSSNSKYYPMENFDAFKKIGYNIFQNLKKEFISDFKDKENQQIEKVELNLNLNQQLENKNQQKIIKKI
jgi:hypothetical protein